MQRIPNIHASTDRRVIVVPRSLAQKLRQAGIEQAEGEGDRLSAAQLETLLSRETDIAGRIGVKNLCQMHNILPREVR